MSDAPCSGGAKPVRPRRSNMYQIQIYNLANKKLGEMKPIKKSKKYWSGEVTRKSNALDLEASVFTWRDPKKIAQSLKRSALASERRKGTLFQSAMSMLNFYINRAGKNLKPERKRILEQAKIELQNLFNLSTRKNFLEDLKKLVKKEKIKERQHFFKKTLLEEI